MLELETNECAELVNLLPRWPVVGVRAERAHQELGRHRERGAPLRVGATLPVAVGGAQPLGAGDERRPLLNRRFFRAPQPHPLPQPLEERRRVGYHRDAEHTGRPKNAVVVAR